MDRVRGRCLSSYSEQNSPPTKSHRAPHVSCAEGERPPRPQRPNPLQALTCRCSQGSHDVRATSAPRNPWAGARPALPVIRATDEAVVAKWEHAGQCLGLREWIPDSSPLNHWQEEQKTEIRAKLGLVTKKVKLYLQ